MRTTLPNEKAYNRLGRAGISLFSADYCCICGQKTDVESEWLLLIREEHGREEYAISHPSDATLEEIRCALWVAPIGPDCLRRHPELRHAVLERKRREIEVSK